MWTLTSSAGCSVCVLPLSATSPPPSQRETGPPAEVVQARFWTVVHQRTLGWIPRFDGKNLQTNIETYIMGALNMKSVHRLCHSVQNFAPLEFHCASTVYLQSALLSQHVGGSLTSCVVFEHQRISNDGIRPFHLWDRLHLEPFVQVAAQQLVGDVGQSSNEDAHCKERQRVSSKQNCHLFCCVHAECVWCECVCGCVCVCWSSSGRGCLPVASI